jgi:predicted DNA-binding protein with PD1-like motif
MARRTIQHPGPVGTERIDVRPVHLREVALTLQPSQALLPALVQALHAAAPGCTSAVLRLHGGTLAPFAYVMPALSKTPAHAVYFSDRFDAPGAVRLVDASVTYGQRDGAPWLHCHARWQDLADGRPHCGHLLPEDVVLTTPMAATAWLLDGAAFTVVPDAETGFTLFRPLPGPPAGDAKPNALAVRVAPNEDICTALEAVCTARGITHATVRGGVGSTVGAAFTDGRVVEPFVTEVLVQQGRIAPGADGRPEAALDVSLVDHTGGLADGRLQRGANGVLVTFELVLQPG